jgi:hypothetical protein
MSKDKTKLVIVTSLLIALCGGIAVFFIPQRGDQLVGLPYHIFLSYPWIFTVLYLGAAIIFLMSLKHFRTASKLAYAFICLGLVVMVLAQSQLGILTYLDAWESKWVQYGLIMLPYLFGGLFLFIGVRLFSRLLDIKYPWNSLRVVIPITIAAILIAIATPHPPNDLTEVIFDMAFGLMVWNALLSTFATIVTFQVKRVISTIFARAMAWFSIALIVHTFSAWQIAAFQVIGFQHWYNLFGFVILPFIIAGFIFLKAGYEFNKANKY